MKPALSTTALSMPLAAAGLLLATVAWTPAGVDLGSRTDTRGSVRDNLTVPLFNHGALPSVTPQTPWFLKTTDPAAAQAKHLNNLNQMRSQLKFTENRGQAVDQFGTKRSDVLYYGGAAGTKLYFTKTGIGYVFNVDAVAPTPITFGNEAKVKEKKAAKKLVMNMELLGSNPSVRVSADEQAPGVYNYFKGEKKDWIMGVGSYHRLRYENIYQNIDMVISSQASGIKYDFVVRPGGDVTQIRYRYAGARSVSVSETGSLRVETSAGTIEEQAPYSYQGENQEVTNAFEVSKGGVISFRTGSFDASQTLVIDPIVRWSTFFGDDASDQFNDIEIADNGTFVAVGQSNSAAITTPDAIGTLAVGGSYSGGDDGLIAKFDGAYVLLWHAYFGGSLDDVIESVELDGGTANVYVMGTTESSGATLPITGTVPQSVRGAGGTACAAPGLGSAASDQFVAALSGAGTLLWSSFKGGVGSDVGLRISVRDLNGATDGGRVIVATGTTDAPGYPTCAPCAAGTTQLGYPGGATSATVFHWTETVAGGTNTATGATEDWARHIGGLALTVGTGVELDDDGTTLIAGYTEANSGVGLGGGFPALDPAGPGGCVVTEHSSSGTTDGYVGRLNTCGTILFLGYHGGSGNDEIVDTGHDVGKDILYVVGRTLSADLPLGTLICGQPVIGSLIASDAYLAKFDAVTGCLECATYHGGSAQELGIDADVLEGSIARNGETVILVCGLTQSVNMPVSPLDNQQGSVAVPLLPGGGAHSVNPTGPQDDMFMVCYSEQCCRLWSTYWGGIENDQAMGISAVVFDGPQSPTGLRDRVVVGGVTSSGDYPTLDPTVAAFGQPTIFPAGEPDGALLAFEFNVDEKLAIDLAAFGASVSGRNVVLGWRTASEDHNVGFEVQRAEAATKHDKVTFKPIASYFTNSELTGLGSSPVGKEYRYVDNDPNLKTDRVYLYRLVDIASDGIRTIHPGITIRLNAGTVTPVYDFTVDPLSPNPTNGKLVTLNFSLRDADAVTVEVYSIDGKKVLTPIDNRSFTAGDNAYAFSVETLAPGVYTAVVSTGNFMRVRTRQFVVVR